MSVTSSYSSSNHSGPTYKISDLASEFSITPRALRFYEEKGLLSPSRRGQTRLYSPADRTRLKLLLRGKRLGLSLEESADIIGMYDPQHGNRAQLEKLLEATRSRKDDLRRQLKELRSMIRDLEASEARTLEALARTAKNPQKRTNGDNAS
jgi:DNA-binding transcriptional MerR regulator